MFLLSMFLISFGIVIKIHAVFSFCNTKYEDTIVNIIPIAAPSTSATSVYNREERGSPWNAPQLISKIKVTKHECRQAEEILVYITLINCINSGLKFIFCNTRSRKFQFTLSNAFSWSRPIIARSRFLELQYSIRRDSG